MVSEKIPGALYFSLQKPFSHCAARTLCRHRRCLGEEQTRRTNELPEKSRRENHQRKLPEKSRRENYLPSRERYHRSSSQPLPNSPNGRICRFGLN